MKFRELLSRSMRMKKKMEASLYSRSLRLRFIKAVCIKAAVEEIVRRSWAHLRAKMEGGSATLLQRMIKGYLERKEHRVLIKESREIRFRVAAYSATVGIQRRMRGANVRTRLSVLKEAVDYIKAYFKMKWLSHMYQKSRGAAIQIQRGVRSFLIRRKALRDRMSGFIAKEGLILDNVRNLETSNLLQGVGSQVMDSGMGNLDPSKSHIHNILPCLRTYSPYANQRIYLFSIILDLDILQDVSSIYNPPWTSQFLHSFLESSTNDAYPQILSLGGQHSLMLNCKGKLYAWGWNDNLQCAKPNNIKISPYQGKHSLVEYGDVDQETTRCKQVYIIIWIYSIYTSHINI